MDFPVDMFLRPVVDSDNLFAFTVGGKALGDESVSVAENGDLILEGYAAVWEGDDREGENFAPGACQRATKAFIDAGGPLCYHHKGDHQLGAVTELEENQKGLRFRARVDGEIQKHPVLATYYHQIKKGTLKGVSIGGFFQKAIINGKKKIVDMDFTEISITGVPMHTGPSFSVVAGKALTEDLKIPESIKTEVPSGSIRDEDFLQLQEAMDSLDSILARVGRRASDDNKSSTDDTAIAV